MIKYINFVRTAGALGTSDLPVLRHEGRDAVHSNYLTVFEELE